MTSFEVQGQTVRLPVVVRKAKAGVAFFDVDAGAAQAFLPGDAFEVVEASPGTNAWAAAASTSKNATPALALRTTTGSSTV